MSPLYSSLQLPLQDPDNNHQLVTCLRDTHPRFYLFLASLSHLPEKETMPLILVLLPIS